MESRVDKAVEAHKNGYNCSQAVFITYADLFGVEKEMALKLSSSFGGGLGGMRQVCGAVSGMSMIAGLYNGQVKAGDKEAKKANYDMVKFLADDFAQEHGSYICEQLLGLVPGLPDSVKKKPCSEYVRTCAILIEKYLLKK